VNQAIYLTLQVAILIDWHRETQRVVPVNVLLIKHKVLVMKNRINIIIPKWLRVSVKLVLPLKVWWCCRFTLIAVWIMGWTCAARFSFGNWWMKCAVFCPSCENRWVRQFPVMKDHKTFPGTNLSSPVSSEFHSRSMEMAKRSLDTSSSKNNLKKSRQKTTSAL
jgi:hypothetical protein